LEGTGGFVATDYNPVAGGFEVSRLGSGVDHIRRIVVKNKDDALYRLLSLENQDIDFCEPVPAPVSDWEDMKSWETHRVINFTYPASNPLWMNLNNRILSNRYVRQAIAHAIDYPYIFSEILPSWGIPEAYQGKALITPLHDYFNTQLEPYEYNIAKAIEYMKMWAYSQSLYAPEGSPEVALGPVGDANLDGVVNFDDFFAWARVRGSSPTEWSWEPGNDIDPDFNNDDAVSHYEDFELWWENWGENYPFDGAR